ncbi:hypothetical protein B9G98_01830 [Wickerhamiella sorbophila]|uniref:Uncharacterized protein n=1 Tax=Wickerhamiella sorbophila TaxID=45607 RepID=A0A2T0FGQ2_9ASCO|nr:hypothetical protein B9G98_01791 [Wickerhamiella sorbophila]XP_024664152.1 hypothetical protein B9G98_01827 [Wickerhamiella sorbophila]XP_024664155.1 hypothetical protein B9G98_01830 [Wickerhamiella sorbophila]PRT54171.1 hypothetical protein B9G98_01791 [Wickerhamiella sorbophila]PRT54207.1 hypothetical protein B9G98_01827 [Wickerhamiella sorbophila]PRT54210.1 hypothetical protein B9G98_01830 [Wickerhamiella sorbophila]
MSEQSKEVILGKNRTTVSTKECELYVEGKSDKSVSNNMKYINFNRLRNNNLLLNYLQKRDLAIIGLRSYSTESGQTNKNVLDELNSLHEFSKNYLNKRIDRKIYNKFMLSKELYILAYQKLRSNLALNAGYLIDRRLVYDIVGTLQGSIISLILANIYLSKLDKFIEELKLEHEDPSKKGKKIRLKEYRSIERKIGVVKKLEASNKRKFDLRKLSTKLRNTKINIKSSYDNKLIDIVKRKGNKTRSLGFLMLTALMKLISKKLALAGFHRYHKGLTKTT